MTYWVNLELFGIGYHPRGRSLIPGGKTDPPPCSHELPVTLPLGVEPCVISPIHTDMSIHLVIVQISCRQPHCWDFMSRASFPAIYRRHDLTSCVLVLWLLQSLPLLFQAIPWAMGRGVCYWPISWHWAPHGRVGCSLPSCGSLL